MTDRFVRRFVIGLMIRRQFRAVLDEIGVEWTEHKGLIESDFVVRGTPQQMERVDTIRFVESP